MAFALRLGLAAAEAAHTVKENVQGNLKGRKVTLLASAIGVAAGVTAAVLLTGTLGLAAIALAAMAFTYGMFSLLRTPPAQAPAQPQADGSDQ